MGTAKEAIWYEQGSRVWNTTLHSVMVAWEFKCLECKNRIYYCRTRHGVIITGIHVDDFLSIASNQEGNKQFITQL